MYYNKLKQMGDDVSRTHGNLCFGCCDSSERKMLIDGVIQEVDGYDPDYFITKWWDGHEFTDMTFLSFYPRGLVNGGMLGGNICAAGRFIKSTFDKHFCNLELKSPVFISVGFSYQSRLPIIYMYGLPGIGIMNILTCISNPFEDWYRGNHELTPQWTYTTLYCNKLFLNDVSNSNPVVDVDICDAMYIPNNIGKVLPNSINGCIALRNRSLSKLESNLIKITHKLDLTNNFCRTDFRPIIENEMFSFNSQKL